MIGATLEELLKTAMVGDKLQCVRASSHNFNLNDNYTVQWGCGIRYIIANGQHWRNAVTSRFIHIPQKHILKYQEPKPTPEDSGGSCEYYRVFITDPTSAAKQSPYTAECNDIIEALDMTYAESNMFKEIWRSAAGRTLGKKKLGHSDKRGADKIVFFANRNKLQKDNSIKESYDDKIN